MSKIVFLLTALLITGTPLFATNYYIATTGNDVNTGLDSASAWVSLDNGDQKSIISPGDTVFVYPGTYNLTASLALSTDGTAGNIIVYQATGDGEIVLDAGGGTFFILNVLGDYAEVRGLELTNGNDNAIYVDGDNCEIVDCFVYDIKNTGILVDGNSTIVRGCIVTKAGDDGIRNEPSAQYNNYYNNTIYDNGAEGIDLRNTKSWLFNNIIIANNNGIDGVSSNVCAFNNVWGSAGDDYHGGVSDSAGGISEDPLFNDASGYDFTLQSGSPCINTGLDLGYSFFGTAPEMGAEEVPELNELIITPAIDSMLADQTYQFGVTALDNLGDPTDPGNLTWGHTFATGSMGANGLFTPDLVGTGTITVLSDINGVSDESETIEVVPGDLDSIYISPDRDTISADSTRQFTATGYDSKGNVVPVIDDLEWDLAEDIGTIDASGLFDAETVGFGFVSATNPETPDFTTDTIFVVAGDVADVTVSPKNDIAEQGNDIQYTMTGLDSDNNETGDLTSSATWSTTDGTGSVDGNGLYTAGTVNGNYYVKGVYTSFADSGRVSVVGGGSLTYVQVELFDGTPLGDTTLSTDNDTTIIYCRGYDGGDVLLGDIAANWDIVDGDNIGSVTNSNAASTAITLTTPGSARIEALKSGIPPDTSGLITCVTGEPAELDITPNSATVTTDSSLQFTSISRDADGNDTDPQVIATWSVKGDIGTITGGGLFDPTTEGIGAIIAGGGGIADTTGDVIVEAGALASIEISPDSIMVGIGDSVQFTAEGFDSDSNTVDAGSLTWKNLGRIGDLNAAGLYIAGRPGICSVQVTSSIGGITDVNRALGVEALYITNIPLGNNSVYPGQADANLLAFRIENYYDADKTITSLMVRDASRGSGIQAQRLTNYDNIKLYYDIDDDSTLTVSDSLIAIEPFDATNPSFTFTPITIAQGTGRTFLVGADIDQFPCDSDSLDLRLVSATDIGTGGGETIDGPAELNSLGYDIVDGMTAGQLQMTATGTSGIAPGDTVYNVLTLDIPRNGYDDDTLKVFGVKNTGTAEADDIDSLKLYLDDGNASWGGMAEETLIGKLTFTGDRWALSGLAVPLTASVTRFYVAARLASYPTNSATIALSVPMNGIEVSSLNDGPIDQATVPIDTIAISASEAVTIEAVNITAGSVVPGESSGPVLGFRMVNGYPTGADIDSLRFNINGVDPDGATQTQLDSQIDSISLYKNKDSDYGVLSESDSLIATATVSGGTGTFATSGLSINGGGEIWGLTLVLWLDDTNCKNGNSFNPGFGSSADLFIADSKTVGGTFPLKNSMPFVLNAFQSSQSSATTVDEGTYFGGESDRLALDFTLPSNGYDADVLSRIKLINSGSIGVESDILTPRLYEDMTGDGFTADDNLLGSFSKSGSYWEISSLEYSVGTEGARLLVTVDIAGIQFKAGTIKLAVPPQGVEYESGMNGPDDNPITNPVEVLVFPSDRITVISIPSATKTVYPRSQNNGVLTFALYNGYVDQDQTLTGLKMTNKSKTASDLDYADFEFGQLSIYYDDDNNRLLDDDSLIASGHFTDGLLNVNGLNIELPAESLSYFFVVADLPAELIDSDSLALAVNSHSDLVFSQSVNINGDLPLSSGGYMIIDGSVKNQYETINIPQQTLSPGDTSITIFQFKPAFNGDLTDTLNAITLHNLKDADDNDISQLELWQDGNDDGDWQSSDNYLGSFLYSGGEWILSGLTVEVDNTPASLFINADVSLSATPNVSIQAEIPKDGCDYVSGNDGPTDSTLIGNGVFIVSSSGIKIIPTQLNSTYSIGQGIQVDFDVTNILGTVIDSIAGEIVGIDNPSAVTLDSSISYTNNLNSGETATLTYYYAAAAAGEVSWQVRAIAPTLTDSTATVQTNTITIQPPPTEVRLSMINSIPTAVTSGQQNIFPFSLRFRHPDTSQTSASFELSQMTLRVEDASGNGITADQVFSRVVISSGYANLSIMETIPTDSVLSFTFGSSLIVSPNTDRFISVLVDIDSLASVSNFVLSVPGASAIVPLDVNTGQAVAYGTGAVFPLKTSSCNIHEPSHSMVIAYTPLLKASANYGQGNVDLLSLRVRHPGIAGSSQIQLTDLNLSLYDSFGDSVVAADIFDKVRMIKQGYIIAENSDLTPATSQVELQLNSPLTLGAQEVDTVIIQASVKEISTLSSFGVKIADSTALTVRDLSSGTILDVITDTAFTLSTASVFPILSGSTTLRYSATAPELCVSDILPTTIAAGRDSLEMVKITLTYDPGSQYSPVQLKRVILFIEDSLGNAINAVNLFDEVGYRITGSTISYQSSDFAYGKAIAFDFDEGDVLINSGDTVSLSLLGDVESDVLFDHFNCVINSVSSIMIQDATDTSRSLGPSLSSVCAVSAFPIISSTSRIFRPADRPTIEQQEISTRLASPGQSGIPVFESDFLYESLYPLGDLVFNGLSGEVYQRDKSGLTAVAANSVFSDFAIRIDGQTIAGTAIFDSAGFDFSLDTGYDIIKGRNPKIVLLCDIQNQAALGNYVILFSDSTFVDLLDKNMGTIMYPEISSSLYPLRSAEISLESADLENSFTNYPNPFNPELGEVTIIGFVLPENAYINIDLFTITGEAIKQVARDSYRTAGAQQQDIWCGFNDRGLAVQPGTYFCRITARYDSGSTEVLSRKITIVR